jgi:hypothetical protein
MNEFERRKCLELTTRMGNMDLCRPFKDKVDPIRDGAPDYLEIVKNPMDLTTARKAVANSEYKSISEWATSINQIWKNAMLYNHEGTLIFLIAQEMEQWFRKKLDNLPRTKDEEWMRLLKKSSKRMFDLSQHPPPSILANRSGEAEILSDGQTSREIPPAGSVDEIGRGSVGGSHKGSQKTV